MNKICVYAICKDEAKEAAEWYANMSEADYVIVVDTGSTDGTPDILEELGCEVHRKQFDQFRFDEAREYSEQFAFETDANIFLAIDFDERLSDGWADIVRELWDPEVHTRGSIPYYVGSLDTNPGLRNWLHSREWGWLYPVHEVMTRRDGSGIWYTTDHCLDLDGFVTMLHRMDMTKKTRKQYLRLCELRYEEHRFDQASMCYLVREYMYAGKWNEMIGLVDDIRQIPLSDNVGCWICTFVAVAYENTGDIHSAEAWNFRAYMLDPECRTAPVNLVRLLCSEGNSELAYDILAQVYETASTWNGYKMFQDAQDVWTWRMDDWMGVLCTRLGRYDEAVSWYTKALKAAEEIGEDYPIDHVRGNLDYILTKEGMKDAK